MDLIHALKDPARLFPDWQPGQSVELLPLLRLAYPGWVRADVLSLQLRVDSAADFFNEQDRWYLHLKHLDEAGNVQELATSLAPITQDQGDNYGFEDHRADEFPADVIRCLLEHRCCEPLSRVFPLFVDQALPLIDTLALASQLDATERQAAFMARVAARLAAELSQGWLKQGCSSVRQGLKSDGLWLDYAGVMQAGADIRAEAVREDLERRASLVMAALPAEVRLALWMQSHEDAVADTAARLGGDHADGFDPAQSEAGSMEPFVERICAQLLTDLRLTALGD